MTYQQSVAVRNAGLDAKVTAIGASPVLKLFSGAEPANCAAADPSGLLCTIQLPATWMNPASNGVATKAGTWSAAASAGGVIASWRLYNQAGSVCHEQGNTTDMTFDNVNVASAQVVTVNSYAKTAGNA